MYSRVPMANSRGAQLTIHGGNGVAIGSLGQYLEDSSVANVVVRDVSVLTHNNDMHNSAYVKTYIGELAPQSGYESAGVPRGGGWCVPTLSRLVRAHPR